MDRVIFVESQFAFYSIRVEDILARFPSLINGSQFMLDLNLEGKNLVKLSL